jgi:hypothetical protein
MSMLRFNEDKLVGQLEQLPGRLRAAFAAACAERLFQNYVRFSKVTATGNPASLAAALVALWKDIGAPSVKPDELEPQSRMCLSLLPSDEPLLEECAYAEDAVASVIYAIDARLKSNSRDAALPARLAYNSLDYYFICRLEHSHIDSADEERIVSEPLIQAELKRQQADINLLMEAARGLLRKGQVLLDLRSRAQADSITFFGSPV